MDAFLYEALTLFSYHLCHKKQNSLNVQVNSVILIKQATFAV